MKKYSLLLVLISIAVFFQAQEVATIITNLKNELKSNAEETKKASIYSDLTWYYSTVSIDSALYYGKKAIEESKRTGDSTLIAQVYSDIGAVYFRKGDFSSSKDNYLEAYKIRKARKDYKGLAKINNNLANIYEQEGDYKLAMAKFLEALQYFESIQDDKNINTIKGNIGLILLKIKNYPKALKYISEVIKYQEDNNLTEGLCVSCLNLGNVYLQMNDTVSALKQYKKSLKACTLVGDNKGMASGYNNIGSIKSEQKKSKDALELYSKSKLYREQLHSDLDKADFDLNFAKELIVAKQYLEAKSLLLAVEKIFLKEDIKEKLQVNYKSLITVYGKLNQQDSMNLYVDKIVNLNRQLLENSVLKQTAELETKYQTEKKEKLLLQDKAETRQKNIMLISISALALLVGLIGLLIYRQQKLKNKQQEREFKLKSEISEIETQNKLQEQRLTISRDLHDNIGSQLTYIISSINNLKYRLKDDARISGQLDKIGGFAGETISELRDTIWAVNSNNIKFDDLRVRIYNAIEKVKHAKPDIKIDFKIDEQLDKIQLTAFVGLNIFRTIQEVVNNALKYADATVISIEILSCDNSIEITAGDNGKGFDMETVSRGNGLNNMAKRIDDIGGEFSLNSKPAEGTQIKISIDKEKLF